MWKSDERGRPESRRLEGMAETEASIELHLRRRVKAMGGMCEKLAPINSGAPDRLVIMPGGRMVLVELKTESGRIRPIQKMWHARALECGVKVVVLAGRAAVDAWCDLMAPGHSYTLTRYAMKEGKD